MADAEGVTTQTVYRWRRHPTWQLGKGPYDLDAVRRWRAENLQEDRSAKDRDDEAPPADGEYPLIAGTGNPATDQILRTMRPIVQGKMREVLEKVEDRAMKNAMARRDVVERAEVEREWELWATRIRASLLAMPRQVAADLAFKDGPAIESYLLAHVEGLLLRLVDVAGK